MIVNFKWQKINFECQKASLSDKKMLHSPYSPKTKAYISSVADILFCELLICSRCKAAIYVTTKLKHGTEHFFCSDTKATSIFVPSFVAQLYQYSLIRNCYRMYVESMQMQLYSTHHIASNGMIKYAMRRTCNLFIIIEKMACIGKR